MSREVPLDGSPDPVGPEPDVYDLDEEVFSRSNIERVASEADLPRRGHRFDPAVDSFDAAREEAYEEWVTNQHVSRRRSYRECDVCGLAQSEEDFPPVGGRSSSSTCVNCLNGINPEDLVKRDPTTTLRLIKQTGFRPTLQVPMGDQSSSTWEVLESPLRREGVVLLTAGEMGLILSRARAGASRGHREIDSWDSSTVEPSAPIQRVLSDLGFKHPVRTGTIDDVDLVGEVDPTLLWHYVVVSRA